MASARHLPTFKHRASGITSKTTSTARGPLTGVQPINKVIDPTFIRVGQEGSRQRLLV